MNARSILLAIACLLVTAVFVIYYLATKETHDLFAEGTPIRATVVKVKRGDRPGVLLKTTDKGKAEETWSELVSEIEPSWKPGATVDALRHRNVSSRVALKGAVEDSEPSPFILVAGLSFVALGGYVLFLPKMRARRRAQRTSGLDVLVDSLRRTRTLTLVVGGGITAFAGFMIWLGASGADRTASAGTNIGVIVLGALFALVGLAIMGRAWGLRSIRGSWIMTTIERRPGEIAWLYEHVVRSVAAPEASATSTIHVWFTDGKSYAISVEREDAAPLMNELSKRAPHAAVGYSPEVEQAYRENPARWRPRPGVLAGYPG